jgi:hypothetical protein
MADLIPYPVPKLDGGYNSYTASKNNIKDNEIPIGQNSELDDNGSVSKSPGSARYGGQLSSGHAVTGIGLLKNPSYNLPIASCNTGWYKIDGVAQTSTLLTGVTFTADLDTDFCEATGKLYGANGTDNLAYTSDGATTVSVSGNGNIGRQPTFYNQRIYMTNSTYPDRVYYSNVYVVTNTNTGGPTSTSVVTGFDDANMFNTNLGASPKLNAGFFILNPGSGIEITAIFPDGNYLFLYTKAHGTWQVGTVSAANADGSIAHTIQQVSKRGNCPAPRSVVKNHNDQWFYNYDGYYSYGEVATYQSPRQSLQSGRIRSNLTSIATAGKGEVAAAPFNEKVIISYQTGTYNDRIIKYDNRIDAFSTPIVGVNASCFLEYLDSTSTRRLLAGSSNPADSYVYQIETGTSQNGAAIQSNFETKSFDCGQPGVFKFIAFIDVFYSLLVGTVTYQVYADESTLIATDSIQIGSSASGSSGIGSKPIGTFLIGNEFAASSPSVQTNSKFRIDCGFSECQRVSVKFTNNNLAEQYKIDSLVIYFQPLPIYVNTL